MDSQSHIPQSKASKIRFSLLYLAHLLIGESDAVGKSGRKARRGRLLRYGNSVLSRKPSYVRLCKARVCQRTDDPKLTDSPNSRPIYVQVVLIRAFQNTGYPQLPCLPYKFPKKIPLAEIASVRRIIPDPRSF